MDDDDSTLDDLMADYGFRSDGEGEATQIVGRSDIFSESDVEVVSVRNVSF